MGARPGFVNAPNRNLVRTTQPGSRPRYTYASPGRGVPTSDARRGGVRRPIFDRNHRFLGYYNSFFPFYGYGSGWPYYGFYNDYYDCYYDPACYADYSQYPPPAQYTDQTDQPGDQDIYAPPPNGGGAAPQYASPSQPSPAAGPDDFVLIRKDGGVLFANGYIIQDGQIILIDSKGIWRKVMLSELDLDATRQWNDELGNPISLPN